MLVILKNNWNRLLEERAYLLVSTVLTICAVAAAILLTNVAEVKGNVAVVTTNQNVEFAKCEYFNVTVLDTAPLKSDLVQHRYDAIVTIDDGVYKVDTIKNDNFKSMVYEALANPSTFVPNTDTERKVGTNIIGYMMMFVLIQGVLYARLYAEDKEKHMIERIAMSPILFRKYLVGHGFFIIILIFIPSFSVLLVAKLVGINIGFSLMQYAVLIAVLALAATSFALFLNSLFCIADTANMLGSSIIVLTSILAGSFYSFASEESIFNKLLHILPQKDFINFVDALEKGCIARNDMLQILYVIGLSVAFLTFAIVKTRKDYIYHQ